MRLHGLDGEGGKGGEQGLTAVLRFGCTMCSWAETVRLLHITLATAEEEI